MMNSGDVERQAARTRVRPRGRTEAQVLMTECPLNTRCVSRNFCDNNGMVTLVQHNDLNFEDDDRGFIVRNLSNIELDTTRYIHFCEKKREM